MTDRTDQPGSAQEKKAGVTLASSEDSLAMRLQYCHSVDDIATLLAIDDFNVIECSKSIQITVMILSPIYSVASIADNVGLVRREVPIVCFESLTGLTDIIPP